MTRMKYVLPLLGVLALVVGCTDFNIFGDNIFAKAGLDTPTASAVTNLATGPVTAENLTSLNDQLSSPNVIALLTTDAGALAQVEGFLLSAYTAPATTPEQVQQVQQAATLYADLNLRTTGGEELVNNITATLLTPGALDLLTTSSTSTSATQAQGLQTLVESLIPAQILDSAGTIDKTAFTSMVNGLVDANGAYSVLTASLSANSTVATPDTVNLGDVAQKALVSYVVDSAVNMFIPTGEDATDPVVKAAAIASFVDFVTAPDITATTVLQPDTSQIATVLSSTSTGFTNIQSLFTLAGLSDLFPTASSGTTP